MPRQERKSRQKDGRYAQILARVFLEKYDPSNPVDEIEFDRSDLDAAAEDLRYHIRNMPDLAYYLRSRAKDLPQIIKNYGFSTLMVVGKGRFRLTKEVNEVRVPEQIEERKLDGTLIPELVREVLLSDEQAILSAIDYTELLNDFLMAHCFHVQGHLRTTGSLGQQVEADDVYVCERNNQKFIVPIEAKGEKEKLGYSQMKSTINAVQAKFAGFPVIPVGIKQTNDGKILVMEFEYQMKGEEVETIKLKRAVRYSIEPRPRKWPPPNPQLGLPQ